jgi:hypothetical protein
LLKVYLYLPTVNELLENKLISHSKERVRYNHLETSFKKLHGQDSSRYTPPIHIKSYEYVNSATPNKKVFKKSTSNISAAGEAENKIDNSFTSINTKRRDDKFLEPLVIKGKPSGGVSIKRSKKDLITVEANIKSTALKGSSFNNRYTKNTVIAPILRKEKSGSKSPKFGDEPTHISPIVSNANLGRTQSNINQLVIEKEIKIATNIKDSPPKSTFAKEASSKIVDDRKFSIMDIPNNPVNINSKLTNNIVKDTKCILNLAKNKFDKAFYLLANNE